MSTTAAAVSETCCCGRHAQLARRRRHGCATVLEMLTATRFVSFIISTVNTVITRLLQSHTLEFLIYGIRISNLWLWVIVLCDTSMQRLALHIRYTRHTTNTLTVCVRSYHSTTYTNLSITSTFTTTLTTIQFCTCT